MVSPIPPETISVVVPTYNERSNLAAAIGSARDGDGVEIIVADGGSSDGTLRLAAAIADRVVHTGRNRAAQLNAGAAAATGSILMFLHADTRLAPGSVLAVRRALTDPKVVGGAFRIEIGADDEPLGVVAWGTNLRTRLFRLPYGDQAIFARASVFARLQGYRGLAIMEDVDFVHRLRRAGKLAIIDRPVQTSARRWNANGIVRTTLVNTTALTLFKLGIPNRSIRKLYDKLLTSHRNSHLPPEGRSP